MKEIYGVVEMGMALANFLTYVDTVKSDIGEYRKSNSGNFIVSGLQLDPSNVPAHILASTDISMEIEKKFNGYNGKSVVQILRDFLNTIEVEEGDEVKRGYKLDILDKLRGIMSNRQLLMPFKPLDQCILDVEMGDGSRTVKSSISSIVWEVNKNTSKFQTRILIKTGNGGKFDKVYKIDIEDYGVSFKLGDIERCLKSSNIDRRVIRMSKFGFVLPIAIEDKDSRFAIDSSNVYMDHKGLTFIIGNWTDKGDIKLSKWVDSQKIKSCSAYKYMRRNLDYIEMHRRFIMPYKLADSNEIRI